MVWCSCLWWIVPIVVMIELNGLDASFVKNTAKTILFRRSTFQLLLSSQSQPYLFKPFSYLWYAERKDIHMSRYNVLEYLNIQANTEQESSEQFSLGFIVIGRRRTIYKRFGNVILSRNSSQFSRRITQWLELRRRRCRQGPYEEI